MGFKVEDKYRKNELSLTPGGSTVSVRYRNGKVFNYDKIKYPWSYIRTIKTTHPEMECWWTNEDPDNKHYV